jgi:L-ascorbate metabolism protein UlaG (beta-lactamase superfamily)
MRNGTRWALAAAALAALIPLSLSGGSPVEPAAFHASSQGGGAFFDGERFHQPEPLTTSFGDWAKRTFDSPRRGPWRRFTATEPGLRPAARVCDDRLRVTFINHATLLVQMDGVNILTDPTWAKRSVPVIGRRRRRPPGLDFDDLPRIDAVLVSHNHQDHMDLPTLRRLAEAYHPAIFTGLGNASFLDGKDIPGGRDLDWWQSAELVPGITVTAVPARHHSGRSLFDQDRTLWCGFVVSGPSGSVYFAGDTGWGSHFAAIGRRFPNLRLAMLPIGGSRPVWYMRDKHIGPEDALAAIRDLKAAAMIPMHFGTFPNGEEGETEPALALDAALDAAPGLKNRVFILDNGQSADVPEPGAAARTFGYTASLAPPTPGGANPEQEALRPNPGSNRP